ncbi:hypothetical protein [Aeromicrobium yanjiei]|uniref:Leucine rich repeat variant domain-containing protein n=1 Tax=Aeromicrobium yanjiei TaxID=2662028 RepID=A0A5Q2ME18_9ACTN|nr:hypothetical protein [Aeromicrobium yanjiei]QGG40858.1 hypothetical protein GEV26_05505 [Aeromicrobium yanjiei]
MASEDLVREAQDPSTSAARLAELAQADRALWPAIAVHPAAYPGLLEWLGQQGDPTVSAVLAMRSSSSAASPAPTEVIPQQVQPSAEQPTAEQPAAQQPAVEEPVAQAPVSPVAEPVVPSQPAEQSYQPVEPTQSYQPVEPTQSYEPVQPTQTFQPVQPSAPAAYAAPADPSYGSVPPGGAAPTGSEPGGNGEDGSKKNFWLLAGMIAAVIVLIGAAAFGAIQVFGGDDDGDDKDEASSSYTKAPLETTEPAPTTTAPTTAAPSVDPGASGASPAFCTQYKELQDETLDSMGGGSDIGKLTESFGRLADAYDDLEDEAPAEVKGDVAVMSDYFDTFKDPSKVDPSDLSGKIREFTDAAQKVSQYYVSNCI